MSKTSYPFTHEMFLKMESLTWDRLVQEHIGELGSQLEGALPRIRMYSSESSYSLMVILTPNFL